jgi:hypothetical protein
MLKRAAAAWGRTAESVQPVLFAAHRTSIEEADNIDYLADTAQRGGLAAKSCDIDHVHLHDESLAPVVEAPGVCVFVCVCVCVFVCVYIYTYTSMFMYVYRHGPRACQEYVEVVSV